MNTVATSSPSLLTTPLTSLTPEILSWTFAAMFIGVPGVTLEVGLTIISDTIGPLVSIGISTSGPIANASFPSLSVALMVML